MGRRIKVGTRARTQKRSPGTNLKVSNLDSRRLGDDRSLGNRFVIDGGGQRGKWQVNLPTADELAELTIGHQQPQADPPLD
jgi:hypothetical protein